MEQITFSKERHIIQIKQFKSLQIFLFNLCFLLFLIPINRFGVYSKTCLSNPPFPQVFGGLRSNSSFSIVSEANSEFTKFIIGGSTNDTQIAQQYFTEQDTMIFVVLYDSSIGSYTWGKQIQSKKTYTNQLRTIKVDTNYKYAYVAFYYNSNRDVDMIIKLDLKNGNLQTKYGDQNSYVWKYIQDIQIDQLDNIYFFSQSSSHLTMARLKQNGSYIYFELDNEYPLMHYGIDMINSDYLIMYGLQTMKEQQNSVYQMLVLLQQNFYSYGYLQFAEQDLNNYYYIQKLDYYYNQTDQYYYIYAISTSINSGYMIYSIKIDYESSFQIMNQLIKAFSSSNINVFDVKLSQDQIFYIFYQEISDYYLATYTHNSKQLQVNLIQSFSNKDIFDVRLMGKGYFFAIGKIKNIQNNNFNYDVGFIITNQVDDLCQPLSTRLYTKDIMQFDIYTSLEYENLQIYQVDSDQDDELLFYDLQFMNKVQFNCQQNINLKTKEYADSYIIGEYKKEIFVQFTFDESCKEIFLTFKIYESGTQITPSFIKNIQKINNTSSKVIVYTNDNQLAGKYYLDLVATSDDLYAQSILTLTILSNICFTQVNTFSLQQKIDNQIYYLGDKLQIQLPYFVSDQGCEINHTIQLNGSTIIDTEIFTIDMQTLTMSVYTLDITKVSSYIFEIYAQSNQYVSDIATFQIDIDIYDQSLPQKEILANISYQLEWIPFLFGIQYQVSDTEKELYSELRDKYENTDSCSNDFACKRIKVCCGELSSEKSNFEKGYCFEKTDIDNLDEMVANIGGNIQCKPRIRMILIISFMILVLFIIIITIISCCCCQECPLYQKYKCGYRIYQDFEQNIEENINQDNKNQNPIVYNPDPEERKNPQERQAQ